ncbi:toll-like receptor 6 [Culex pipiens pallens]|uniref:toll-like receptor 6 n=1 Tax=Culex pipiens pallens TaxID=42434 RepID=UPI0022AA23FD|nr:toll-like receptor 6 [Culex pipiens pallens]
MGKICFIFIIVLLIIGGCHAETVKFKNGVLKIFDINIRNKADVQKLSKYSNYTSIQFERSQIGTMTAEMLQQLNGAVNISLISVDLNVFQILPQFRRISLLYNKNVTVEVDTTAENNLQELEIRYASYKKLPEKLRSLENLEVLDLRHNQILYVNLDELSGMKKLRLLNLNHNKIIEFDSFLHKTINLEGLETLFIHSNQLVEVNFKHWNATSLRHIDLQDNKLSVVLSLLTSVPALGLVNLNDNPFDCEWKDFMLKEASVRKVATPSLRATNCTSNNEKTKPSVPHEVLEYETFKINNILKKAIFPAIGKLNISVNQNIRDKMIKVQNESNKILSKILQIENEAALKNTQLQLMIENLSDLFYRFVSKQNGLQKSKNIESEEGNTIEQGLSIEEKLAQIRKILESK